MSVDVEVIATSACVLSNKALLVSLGDGSFDLESLVPELASDVDIGSLGSHSVADNEGALDELMWIVSQNFSVLASSRLGLISVDDQIGGPKKQV